MVSLQISGIFNIVSDVAILLVPIVASWNLKLQWRKKVGVCAILTIGAIAPAVSAIGFAMRHRAAKATDITFVYLQLQFCVYVVPFSSCYKGKGV
ncbi:hypothetical protein N0V90_004251 [Kalmusia sp. IMI 367209]|nr:hypothetical protein N0V90_004251 [Kalmusia sp. IMI 367209]